MRPDNHRSPGQITLGCIILCSFIVIASGCAGAGAGAGATAGAAASSQAEMPRFAGTWDGSFDGGMVYGGMRLVLNYENDTYTGTLEFEVEGSGMSSDVSKFETEGNKFSFWTNVEGMDVKYEGTLEGVTMAGILEAYMGSDVMGEGTFTLTKK